MEKTLYLEAAREGDTLKIGISERLDSDLDPCIDLYEVKELSMEKLSHIEELCRETMNFLGSASGKQDINCRAGDSLKKMGEMLCDELLTSKIKETIDRSDASSLIIRMDDKMVQIPWELICLKGLFLCERFNLGRVVRTRQDITDIKTKHISYPINMWILANPGKDLSSADKEGELILKIADTLNPDDETLINASLDSSNVTPEKISSKIKNSDIVHFAGHAEYDAHHASQSGWKLSDGYFSPQTIDKMAGSSKMPAIVFSNACLSARTDEWKQGHDSFGIVNAFLRAGVKYYVGTAWEIMDTPSTRFACEFYNQLFSGKSIGESVRLARIEIKSRYSNDYVGWAGYLLYGDPRYKVFDTVNETNTFIHEKMTPAAVDAEIQSNFRGTFSEKDQAGLKLAGKKTNSQFIVMFMTIAVIVSSGIWGFSFLNKRFDLDVLKFNKEWLYREKERNDDLIENIIKYNKNNVESQTDRVVKAYALTVALVYNPINPIAGMVASTIKKDIRQKFPDVRFVERQELNTLLEEANLAFALPSDKTFTLNMLPADYIIKLKADESSSGMDMDLNLLSTKSGENLLQDSFKLKNRKEIPEKIIDNIVTLLKHKG
ncbi:MAG: CHAT domain-containing protein [Proteobacteria bacterium]|nr:CHAT domain-containing protein [Pseudomonadota bacterium]